MEGQKLVDYLQQTEYDRGNFYALLGTYSEKTNYERHCHQKTHEQKNSML